MKQLERHRFRFRWHKKKVNKLSILRAVECYSPFFQMISSKHLYRSWNRKCNVWLPFLSHRMPNRCLSNCFTFLTDGYAFIRLVGVLYAAEKKMTGPNPAAQICPFQKSVGVLESKQEGKKVASLSELRKIYQVYLIPLTPKKDHCKRV